MLIRHQNDAEYNGIHVGFNWLSATRGQLFFLFVSVPFFCRVRHTHQCLELTLTKMVGNPSLLGDINCDGIVDEFDFALMALHGLEMN